MSREEFERVVARALDGLPDDLGEQIENVAVVVEDEPTDEELRDVGLDPETETLFGLYQGVSLDQRGASSRHLAATLAMVLAMAQANVSMPMAAMGLHFGVVLGWSLVGGLVAAAATYYGFGRHLSSTEHTVDETLQHPVAESAKGVLDVINRAGAEAFKIAVGSIPMLVLSLTVVLALRRLGALDALTTLLAPLLLAVGAEPALILPTLTKFLAGGTAMMGIMDEMLRAGTVTAATLNGASAGLLIHPLDVPGVAVLLSAGRRVADVWKPAALGALVGLAVRIAGHMIAG